MLLDPVWQLFEDHVFPTPSSPGLFNLYRDRHDELDLPDAPALRRDNLRRYLACYDERPPLFLLAEAPGPWGCRFSGVPFTSEAQLEDAAFPIPGRASSLQDEAYREYSGAIYWRVLRPYFPHFFTWNSVPYHPYRDGDIDSIRAPRVSELKANSDVLADVLEELRPERVLAVGRKAEYALDHVGADAEYVRHPSQGGARIFEAAVLEVIGEMGLSRIDD